MLLFHRFAYAALLFTFLINPFHSFSRDLVILNSDSGKANLKWDRIYKDPLFIGLEASRPILRYGYKSNVWMGPSFYFLGGLMHFTYQTGKAEVSDSGRVYQNAGSAFKVGFNIPLFSVVKPNIEIIPSLGIGIGYQGFEDRRLINSEDQAVAAQMGIYLRPSIMLKLGPVIGTLSYNVQGMINFSKSNAFSGFSHYPSLGIMFSSMPILMNPRDFSSDGLRHYKDLVSIEKTNSGLYVDREVSRTSSTITYRREQIQWIKSNYAHRYEKEVAKCNDIRPFTYLGPRFTSSTSSSDQILSSQMLGLNLGFRYSLSWVNAYYERGDVRLQGNATQYEIDRTLGNRHFPPFGGHFKNSSRYGIQVGIELVANAMKSKFKPNYAQRRAFRKATCFTGFLPYLGYGVADLGDFQFSSASAEQEALRFETLEGRASNDRNTIKKSQQFFTLGFAMHLGAVGLGFEHSFYPDAKKLNGTQMNVSLNLPVIRIGRAMFVKSYLKKLRAEKV